MPSSLTLERNVFKMINEVRRREERKREEVGEAETYQFLLLCSKFNNSFCLEIVICSFNLFYYNATSFSLFMSWRAEVPKSVREVKE